MPSSTRSATLTFDQLRISPHNVRTNRADTKPTEAFARTIEAFGLIHPLRVHPMRGGKFMGVHVGRRRYETIGWLIEQGRIPADWPIDVTIREGASDAELLQESEVENRQRTDLRPYELFQGVAKAHRRGAAIAQIAMNIGEDEAEIARWLRLGNLVRPVFEALEAGVISVDQAKAFGATEDHALQSAAFEEILKMSEAQRTPAAIRGMLGIGDAELQRFLRLVGVPAYEAAGGQLERDLFTSDDPLDARVMDPQVLRALVDARLAQVRDELRVKTENRDLRFVPAPPRTEYGQDWSLSIKPTVGPSGGLELPEGDVVACVTIDRNGEIVSDFWWASRKAKADAERGDATVRTAALAGARPATRDAVADGSVTDTSNGDSNAAAANASVRVEDGLSQEALQIFRSLRRVTLRGALIDHVATQDRYALAGPALDWLVWSQLRLMLTDTRINQLGSGYIANQSSDPPVAQEHIRATEAWHRWTLALYELQQQSFLTDADLASAFLDYRCSPIRLKQLAIAVVTGIALERSLNGPEHRIAAHDALAAELGLDDAAAHELVPPTAAMLDLLPKGQRLAIAEPLVERASFAPWSRLKSTQLTKAVLEVVTGASKVVRASSAEAAAHWVHPLLRFDTDPTGPGEREAPLADDVQLDDVQHDGTPTPRSSTLASAASAVTA